jgi:hypothetical protein
MTISQLGARRRPAERRAPRLVALPPRRPEPEVAVSQALQALDDVNSELPPRTQAALQAIVGAVVSLVGELHEAHDYSDRLNAHLEALEARFDSLATSAPPASDRSRTGRPWTSKEDRRLRELTAQGFGINGLAMHLDRSFWSVWRRSRVLGLTRPRTIDARAWTRGLSRARSRLRDALRALREHVPSPIR